jgi:hypothetical protein
MADILDSAFLAWGYNLLSDKKMEVKFFMLDLGSNNVAYSPTKDGTQQSQNWYERIIS